MNSLRIRIELNRGGVGVPLEKLAKVVAETQSFLSMLCDDVRINSARGQWLGLDFDPESLNFKAEFVGPVTAEEIEAFNDAFDGVTPLRRATIRQFARIGESIEGDELIGFGLYHGDAGEPSEWRCLSKRDALRITEAIRTLEASSGAEIQTPLPAPMDSASGARYFQDRRDRGGAEPKHLTAFVRDVETRVTRLEKTVDGHASGMEDLRARTGKTEETFRNLLSAVEDFCDQATKRIEQISGTEPAGGRELAGPHLAEVVESAAGTRSDPVRTAVEDSSDSGMARPAREAPQLTETAAPVPVAPGPTVRKWSRAVSIAAAAVIVAAASYLLIVAVGREQTVQARRQSELPAPKSDPSPRTAAPPPPATSASEHFSQSAIELTAVQPVWVSATADGENVLTRVLETGTSKTIDFEHTASIRVGNAGGVEVRFNGRKLGPLGPDGKVRLIQFEPGKARVLIPK